MDERSTWSAFPSRSQVIENAVAVLVLDRQHRAETDPVLTLATPRRTDAPTHSRKLAESPTIPEKSKALGHDTVLL
jgi:hypothetical protein